MAEKIRSRVSRYRSVGSLAAATILFVLVLVCRMWTASAQGQPSISIIGPAPVFEGNSGSVQANFTLNLSSPAVQPITVRYSTSDGFATGGSDYQRVTDQVASFTAGTSTTTISITVFGDTVEEGSENFSVNLSNPVNATLGFPSFASCTIVDDDIAPPPAQPPAVFISIFGPGAVTVNGTSCAANCVKTFPSGTTLTLSASGTSGPGSCFSGFTGWAEECAGQGNPCTLSLTRDLRVTANFRRVCPLPPPAIPLPPPPPTTAPGVPSGSSGGLESSPLWMWNKKSGLPDRISSSPRPDRSSRARTAKRPASLNLRRLGPTFSISLEELLPGALAGMTRKLTEPQDVIGNSNALEAIAADYLPQGSDTPVASINVFRTTQTVYAHDYGVCSRFKGGQMESIARLESSGFLGTAVPAYVWFASMARQHPQGGVMREQAAMFAVHVSEDERSFRFDSRWLSSEYPVFGDQGYILTFQIWAMDSATTAELAREVLRVLAARGPISYQQATATQTPQVFIADAVYDGRNARLRIVNDSSSNRTVLLNSSNWRAPYPESEISKEFLRAVPPGITIVELPLPGLLNGLITLDDGTGFKDAVFVADGHWFGFDDRASGGSSAAEFFSRDCTIGGNDNSSDIVIAGCGRLQGQVNLNGWAGMARAMNPPNRATLDVRNYESLSFFVRGDGKSYRVGIETEAVAQLGSADWHQFVFTAPPEGRKITIPLAVFKQQGWDASKLAPFTGKAVRALVWSTVGDPHSSVDLSVDRVAFGTSIRFHKTTVLTNTIDAAGPYPVSALITDDTSVQSATLHYSIDGGRTYSAVSMGPAGRVYSAAIPGQPLGSVVRYYLSANDGDENTGTDPANAPYTVYRFQVSERPHLLINDFSVTDTDNLLGLDSALFGRDTGSAITTSVEEGALRIDYDVTRPGSFAGYTTELGSIDHRGFNAVTMLVKGAAGAEKLKLGLSSNNGEERKILIGQYLEAGITKTWQKVVVPLVAFTSVHRGERLERFVLAVENRVGSGKGTVFIDDVKLETIPGFVPTVIDNFNDAGLENAVGGSLFTSSAGGAGVAASYDSANPHGPGGAAYRITFQGVTSTAWAVAGSDLMGLDASKAGTLSFFIRGEQGGERPRIYLVSGRGPAQVRRHVKLEDYIGITRAWQRVEIPLGTFADLGVDVTNLVSFQIVFEGSAMSGTIYVDDVRLEGGNVHVKVLFPNQRADRLKAGSTVTVRWESSSPVGLVSHDVLLSNDNGATYVAIATGLPGAAQSFVYVVPPSDRAVKKARIRVVAVDASGNTSQDDSDEPIKIKAGG
jgi:hypothetical protein